MGGVSSQVQGVETAKGLPVETVDDDWGGRKMQFCFDGSLAQANKPGKSVY